MVQFFQIYAQILLTSTLTTSLPLLLGNWIASAKVFTKLGFSKIVLSCFLSCLTMTTPILRNISAIVNQCPLSPLPSGMKMLYLLFSRSTTPNRRKHPPYSHRAPESRISRFPSSPFPIFQLSLLYYIESSFLEGTLDSPIPT